MNGSLAVMSKYFPKEIWRGRGAAPSEEQTTVGRIVPLALIENKFTNADVGRVFKIAQC